MSDLQRYQCDFCENAYNKEPAATHTIDGEENDLCEECKREFDRVTDYPEGAAGIDYQYHGFYFPKSTEAEAVWRHIEWVQENHVGLAEWVVLDWLLISFHEHYIENCSDEEQPYRETRDSIENDVRVDESFNASRY